MAEANVGRSGCSFSADKTADGKAQIRLKLFHDTIPALAGSSIEFELLTGTTVEQARRLVEGMNERILSMIISRP